MPWEIRKENGKHCVYKEGDSSPLKCHATDAEAKAHLRALYASEDNARLHTYSIDLLATDSAVARRALDGEPILIYPKGEHHRFNPWTGQVRTWTVDDAIVAQLVDNYAHRTERGIRQARLPVNEDHNGSRALGWFDNVVALPGGLGATFAWNRKGREALENGEFSYFSAEIYDEVLDRVTGEPVKNQLSGGALTNYPFFGEATSLMSRDAATLHFGGYRMDETLEQVQAERNGLLTLFARLFGGGGDAPPDPPDPQTAEIPEDFREQFTQLQEQVAQFNTQLQTVQTERDTYAQQVQALTGQLSAVQDARAVEHYARMADTYAHLPAPTGDLATNLRWLHEADPDGEHTQFFTNLLRQANESLGVYFREIGIDRRASGDAEAQIETQAREYASEHGVPYAEALRIVVAENPALERAYHREQGGH